MARPGTERGTSTVLARLCTRATCTMIPGDAAAGARSMLAGLSMWRLRCSHLKRAKVPKDAHMQQSAVLLTFRLSATVSITRASRVKSNSRTTFRSDGALKTNSWYIS